MWGVDYYCPRAHAKDKRLSYRGGVGNVCRVDVGRTRDHEGHVGEIGMVGGRGVCRMGGHPTAGGHGKMCACTSERLLTSTAHEARFQSLFEPHTRQQKVRQTGASSLIEYCPSETGKASLENVPVIGAMIVAGPFGEVVV